MLHIPAGALAVPSNDDNAAAAQRRRIAEMLRNNEPISVSHTGTVHSANETPDGTPVEAINTPDDLPVQPDETEEVATGTITWALASGATESGACSAGIAEYITPGAMTTGPNLTIDGTRNVNGTTMTVFGTADKQSTASSRNRVSFAITPANGYYFTPTRARILISRIGTDSGVFDLAWSNGSGETALTTGHDINRNKAENGWHTDYSTAITDVLPATGEAALQLNIYNVNAGKQTAVAGVVIEGSVSQLATGISDATADGQATISYYDLQGRRVAAPARGLHIRTETAPNGLRKTSKVVVK